MLTIDDFVYYKFKHAYHNKDLNYDVFDRKVLNAKIIFQLGESEEHFFDIPITWIVRNNLTVFKGKVQTKEELGMVLRMVDM